MQSQIRRALKQALENARLYNLVAWAHLPKLISCYILKGISEYGNKVIRGLKILSCCTCSDIASAWELDCWLMRENNRNEPIHLFTHSPIQPQKEVNV